MMLITVAFVIVSVFLIAGVLVQARSAGMSSAFGGGSEGFHVRRGSEKVIFRITSVLGALFIILALSHLFIK